MDEALLDVRETARLLRVHESKIYDLARQGRLPVLRVGSSLRFQRSALMDWIQRGMAMPLQAREPRPR